MRRIYKTTNAVELNGVTKKLMGSIRVPQNVSKLVGALGYAIGGAGLTTLENVSGIITLESTDQDFQPQVFPLNPVGVLGTGLAPTPDLKIYPMEQPVESSGTIDCSITLDLAQTITNKGRVTLIFE